MFLPRIFPVRNIVFFPAAISFPAQANDTPVCWQDNLVHKVESSVHPRRTWHYLLTIYLAPICETRQLNDGFQDHPF